MNDKRPIKPTIAIYTQPDVFTFSVRFEASFIVVCDLPLFCCDTFAFNFDLSSLIAFVAASLFEPKFAAKFLFSPRLILRFVVVVSVGYCLPVLSGGDNFVLVLVSSTVSEVIPLSVDDELVEVLITELIEVFTSSFVSF